MTQEELASLKFIYSNINISDAEVEQKWNALSSSLPNRAKPSQAAKHIPYVVLLSITFIVLFSILTSTNGVKNAVSTISSIANSITKTVAPKAKVPENVMQKINIVTKAPTPTPTKAPTPTPKIVENKDVKGAETRQNNSTHSENHQNPTSTPTQSSQTSSQGSANSAHQNENADNTSRNSNPGNTNGNSGDNSKDNPGSLHRN